MNVASTCQRWRAGRASYRPQGEPINTRRYEVHEFTSDTEAREFVCREHYSKSIPSLRFRFGLYEGPFLVGVALFSHPQNNKTLTNVFEGESKQVLEETTELGRFVLLDRVPANGETWFLGRAFELLRDRLRGVVAFSDPKKRINRQGRIVMPGHVGTIYQAFNGVYLGRSAARTLRLLDDGTVFCERSLSKIRSKEKSWAGAVERLVRNGAERPGSDLRAWLKEWLPKISSPFRHPGNHKYAWELAPRRKWSLPPSQPYPKKPKRRPRPWAFAYQPQPNHPAALRLRRLKKGSNQ